MNRPAQSISTFLACLLVLILAGCGSFLYPIPTIQPFVLAPSATAKTKPYLTQPVTFHPTATLNPYPQPVELPTSTQTLPVYPGPNSPTATPDCSLNFCWETVTPSVTPTKSAFVHSQFFPKCDRQGSLLVCSDYVIDIQFSYPSRWGMLISDLFSHDNDGSQYSYRFDGNGMSGNGKSPDYHHATEASFSTMFACSKPNHCCEKEIYQNGNDCRQINDNKFIATVYPEIQSICEPIGGTVFSPLMVVGINLPPGHPVSEMVFYSRFLSTKATDQLFEPLGGVYMDQSKCNDPAARDEFTRRVEVLAQKVNEGSLDEESRYLIKGIQDFANSIVISQ